MITDAFRYCCRSLAPLLALAALLFSSVPSHAHAAFAATLAATAADSAQQPSSNSPTRTTYSLPPEKMAKAIRLSRAEAELYFCETTWIVIFLWILLETRTMANLRDWAQSKRSTRFHGLLIVAAFVLLYSFAQLPAAVVSHHLSLEYGLSVEGWPAWIRDWCKSTFLFLFSGNLIAMCLMATIRRSPRRWWLWFWLIIMPLVVLATYLIPKVIDPLYNHFEPLAATHPALVDQLERVVARGGIDIPPSRMFLMKASEKYTTVNAYVTGFGASKRVVVWDTTIDKAPPDEIMFIYGHEQGHYARHHIAKGMIFAFALILFFLWIGFHITRWLIRTRGERWHIAGPGDWAAIGVLMLVFYLLNFMAQPIANGFARTIEHHADIYGQEVIHGLVPDPQRTAASAFQQLGEESLDNPNPNPFIEFWTYDHPSISERMRFAGQYDPWVPGQYPRYFPRDR